MNTFIPYSKRVDTPLSNIIGMTFSKVEVNDDNDMITFTTENNRQFVMFHSQDCCEDVTIEGVVGDLSDLVGEPILLAEEIRSNKNPDGVKIPEYQDSFTWTFYKLATRKGYVDIRWYGESNGYYSEEVDFIEVIE